MKSHFFRIPDFSLCRAPHVPCLVMGFLLSSDGIHAQNTDRIFSIDGAYELRSEYRTVDGSHNNRALPTMGAAKTMMPRWFRSDYDDDVAAMSGGDRPSARVLSNQLLEQRQSFPNRRAASDFLWIWGQWIDHDMTLVQMEENESEDILVPNGDPIFDRGQTGVASIPFKRSESVEGSGFSTTYPRQQVNDITSWIDASNVYGSEPTVTQRLRTLDGTGRLKTSLGNFLPIDEEGAESSRLFVAGDERVNEHTGLMAIHTLFMREHNRFVEALSVQYPQLSGETLFQEGRAWVGALLQVITYNEFLPVLLSGRYPSYRGYSPQTNGATRNEFATAAFRVGHTMVNETFIRLDEWFNTYERGHLSLVDAFTNTRELTEDQAIEALFRGLAVQTAQRVDTHIIDDLRNFLFPFEAPNRIGFDLASLNLQRGRDHGLPTFMSVWRRIGGWPIDSFSSFHARPSDKNRLMASAYFSIHEMDLWVGLLAEQPRRGHLLGQALEILIGAQFWVTRQADRFWYERMYSGQLLQELENTRLSDVIIRNTNIEPKGLPRNVFLVPQSMRHLSSDFWKNR